MPWGAERLRRLSIAATLGAALPAQASEGRALLELRLDGRSTERVESFLMRDGVPHATRADWRRMLGRPLAPQGIEGTEESVSVEQLAGVDARVDLARQTLDLSLAPDPSALTILGGAPSAVVPETAGSLAALLNYDLSLLRVDGRTVMAGLFEGRVLLPQGLLEHLLLANDALAPRVNRLQTTFTHSDPQALRRLRAGDVINGGLAWTRPVRLLGVQAITDFALRPGLVTAPTPQLGGQAAVPSTVDVFVNGVRQLSQPVEAGRFEVRQLPVVSGLAEVAVVVRDALGRETVQTLPFYAASQQLAAGLSAYAFELGRVRRGYATADSRYEDPAASATWRQGFSDALTLEAHGEATRGAVTAGGGAMRRFDALGVLHGALAAGGGAGRRGLLASVGAERQSRRFGFSLAHTRSSAGYRDIAGASGDPSLRRSTQLGLGADLAGLGRVGLALIDRRQGPAAGSHAAPAPLRLASMTWARALGGGVQALVSGYRDLGQGGGGGLTFGLSLPYGAAGSAAAAVSRDRGGSTASVHGSRAATAPGEFGWRLQADQRLAGSGPTRRLAQGEFVATRARASAELEQSPRGDALRLGLQGALVATASGVHATRRVHDSVAVVDVDGQPDVAVYHENRLVGRTDARGQILVPDLLSFQTNRVAIDPLDLPLDIDPGSLMRELRPGDRAVLPLRFRFERTQTALLELRDATGAPLPVGARARIDDQAAAPAVVGHDGLAYLRGLSSDNRLRVDWGPGQGCSVRFGLGQRDARTGRIGPLACE